MSDQQKTPSRLELYKAGKLEERKSPRRPHIPEEPGSNVAEQKSKNFFLRPELIALGVFAVFLLILALIGIK